MGASWLRAFLAAGALAAVLAPSAMGATPRQIYSDMADNGRLDQAYTQAELRAALRSAVLQGYGNEVSGEELPSSFSQAGGESQGVLPFTGLDLALLVGFGLTMLLLGVGFRSVRPKKAGT